MQSVDVDFCLGPLKDPDFRGDPSGCTAVSMIVTEDLKLICVSRAPQRAPLA